MGKISSLKSSEKCKYDLSRFRRLQVYYVITPQSTFLVESRADPCGRIDHREVFHVLANLTWHDANQMRHDTNQMRHDANQMRHDTNQMRHSVWCQFHTAPTAL